MTLRLAWDRGGAGEPLLLLHGIGSTHDDFVAVRPQLEADHAVLAPDLPGHGGSPALRGRPTVGAIADVLEADLDALGIGRVHVLGNSLGARLALELAGRGRALSVVAIAPSGLNVLPERLYQGTVLSLARLALRAVGPRLDGMARSVLGRTVLFTGLRAAPWRAGEAEARALRAGFAESADFWRTLWWGVLVDLPAGMERIDCPVVLAQGTADVIAGGQTPRYLWLIAGSRFVPLLGAGHAPQSDVPGAIVQLVRRATTAARRRRSAGADSFGV
ncbi:alpha/beta fold hydrolase [Pseudonocardia yuanmonensis]|uniref:Alpha/beta fold hydrolase n=1 Tax=Pseudonocardia yuanmonensis TaxID=1095914 RepID=A0ABP8WZ92_9PSEU